ncbi:putative ribonuclease H-like domain-containing protein [Tanacetum coccineum]
MNSKNSLTRSGPISINVVRPVNTVQSRTAVNNAGPIKNVVSNGYSTARRPFNKITTANNSNFTKKVNVVKGIRVNTARPKAIISAVKGNKGNVVKASACWVWRPKQKNFRTMSPEKVSKLNDESLVILKVPERIIVRIENLIDLKVKVIRCDNGTEFKNRVMNQFCEMKGIMKEFSVARTPQQNGVAERKNRTLIEAARTMLADLKLPTTF